MCEALMPAANVFDECFAIMINMVREVKINRVEISFDPRLREEKLRSRLERGRLEGAG
jgi:hypothetical protein